jgi:thiol-disulfide isomerase/thioredoxin
MGEALTAVKAGPAPPDVVREAMQAAGAARRQGRLDLAISGLERGLARLRDEPFSAPFLARVQLGLALADAYLDAGDRPRARQLLLDEAGYAERIFHLTRLSGGPEQQRAASAGRLQVRDRAVQVELLGQDAPELGVEDWIQGDPTTLAELRGKVVLLEFWATWCRPCLELLPRMGELHRRYDDQGLEILALTHYPSVPRGADPAAIRARERDLVRTVVAGRGLSVRVGIAPDARLQQQYGAMGVPTLVVIDRAGTVRLIASGGDDAMIEAAIEAALASE